MSERQREIVRRFLAAQPRFEDVRVMILAGLKDAGWTVVPSLKIPHATSPDKTTRLWFKTRSVYLNDLDTDPRDFAHTHSLSSDIREYPDTEALLKDVARMRAIQKRQTV